MVAACMAAVLEVLSRDSDDSLTAMRRIRLKIRLGCTAGSRLSGIRKHIWHC